MSSRRRLLIDLDGVIANFTQAYCNAAIINNLPGARSFRQDEILSWDWVQEQLGWTRAQEDELWRWIRNQQNWWMSMEPLVSESEIEQLNYAIRDHDIYFVTARPRTRGLTAETQSRYWLEGIGVHAAQASVIASRTKGQVAAGLDIEVALDDSLKNLQDLQQHGILAVARHWEYNKEWPGPAVLNLGSFLRKYAI